MNIAGYVIRNIQFVPQYYQCAATIKGLKSKAYLPCARKSEKRNQNENMKLVGNSVSKRTIKIIKVISDICFLDIYQSLWESY